MLDMTKKSTSFRHSSQSDEGEIPSKKRNIKHKGHEECHKGHDGGHDGFPPLEGLREALVISGRAKQSSKTKKLAQV
jgi:hypothetical protein